MVGWSVSAAGCGKSDSGSGAAVSGGSGGSAATSTSATTSIVDAGTGGTVPNLDCSQGFASEPLHWPVPPEIAPTGASSSCTPAKYLIKDYTGDGLPDLVGVEDCNPDTPLGLAQWTVYPNTAAGFGAPLAWPVPPEFEADGALNTLCTPIKYGVYDLTGDGVDELIAYDDCDEETPLGATVWQVRDGTGSGFGVLRDWTIPPEIAPDGLRSGSTAACQEPPYRTLDVTGDGVADLLQTGECSGDTTAALTPWRVFVGGDGGFAQTPSDWTVPEGLAPLAYADGRACPDPRTVPLNLTGDGVLDLLYTDDCDDSTPVGRTEWHVYPGGPSGYGARTVWALPTGVELDDFASYSCSDGSGLYGMLDVDGNELADLVIRDDCDAATPLGASEWHVYPSTGSGFSEVQVWPLPPDLLIDPDCVSQYLTQDFNADGLVDLAVTSDCDEATPLGTDHWQMYLGQCQ